MSETVEEYGEAAGEIVRHEVAADEVKLLDKADDHIRSLKDEVVRRSRLLERTEQARKDVMAGWRDTIKEQKKLLSDSIERLGAMEERRRVIAAGGRD